ncbi:long-chain-acyl-CoA synthetase [Halioglobus maricola]|uniref:Long-chain-acyl-CoA synthetase n=1 Tax=Halioglobus maricola TaxID=2601894 RepID=A0A5P9NMT9_9GAMM|nr:long-chain-acyl-CoA synthetase [Halioglobus maricola]QFU76584.1 long-chain-acyl-CoA synthetase [Halioglobus maricola]
MQNAVNILKTLPMLAKLPKLLKPRPDSTKGCISLHVQLQAERFPYHTAISFEGDERTWDEFNREANRFARALQNAGVARGDAVSVLMENRIEYLSCLIAINKLGACAALINTNLSGGSLAHCLTVTNSTHCIIGEERCSTIAELLDEDLPALRKPLYVADSGELSCPDWANDLGVSAAAQQDQNLAETDDVTISEDCLYIFTSGTTGMPKASVMSNKRLLATASLSAIAGLRCDEHDCIYLCLPLYHGTGLFLGVGAAFTTGASIYLRRKFSASAFVPEVRESGATCFMYIGEICRYLLATPEHVDDHATSLRTIMGNGLRPDIWHAFKDRFGIDLVSEFYGSSEGNISAINLFNKDCTIGTIALPHALVRYDVDNDEIVRDQQGYCIRAEKGEPGLVLGEITPKTQFEGYTNKEATEAKILRDVFKPGDAWFNTGDLLKQIEVGFALGLPHYQFVDRVGDTFRWKGENVSTNEVGEIINTHDQVHFSNIYGVEVPGTDGRAGMAALILEEGCDALDVESFSKLVTAQLPAYARPLFLRVLPQMDTTGTFKMLKGDLRKEGFDPALVDGPLYALKPGSAHYEPLEQAFFADIQSGRSGY